MAGNNGKSATANATALPPDELARIIDAAERIERLREASRGRLTRASTVLTIVPHFHCHQWLGDCLASLVDQTRPPEGIVVVDDGTGQPPVEIVRAFPSVTLLETVENVGPYRISQTVIERTGYDAYMFQDADDWSLPERLQLELEEAERSGAEVVGCQGHRLISAEGEMVPITFPRDVNAAHRRNPVRHAIKHPGSIVSRELVMRIGGYATGLRFGADTEFEHRATHVARMINIPQFAYVVRNRENSLTSSADTGIGSPARNQMREIENARALENVARVAAGEPPDLTPQAVAGPVEMLHLAGPLLRSASGGSWPC
ncbi:MAG TPA: glycosyltransferase family A protein [Thermomicrobiales bacterium]|nr:glycosyltransferase family A protein [Thermomicrobiales bacterium]